MQREHEKTNLSKLSILHDCGVCNCFLRYADSEDHFSTLSPKVHQHAFNELHLILEGSQQYQIGATLYTVPAGHLLLIPADMPHRHIGTGPNTRKYSISFSAADNSTCDLAGFFEKKLLVQAAAKNAINALIDIEMEADPKSEYTIPLIESKIFQFLLYTARDADISERTMPIAEDEDPRLKLAKQYIQDNIDRAMGCQEVADYCHLSQKQLQRLFTHDLGSSTASYIRSQRIARIEQLLTESTLSLEQISEMLHFSNVYHFNTFFSKYAGIAPGRFRKMHNPNR